MSWTFLDSTGRIKELLSVAGVNPTHTIVAGSGTSATTGTYTTPAGCTAIFVECIGAGAGGGGTGSTSAGQSAAGGGGGGGAYAASLIFNPSASYAYSVGGGGTAGANTAGTGGTGGDTTLGSTLVVAKGGLGGTGQAGATAPFSVDGGIGGAQASCVGDITLDGGGGGEGVTFASTIGAWGGDGGGAANGAPRAAGPRTGAAPGRAGLKYGGGGCGAGAIASQAGQLGGVGGAGLLIITEFYGVRSVQPATSQINFTTQDFSAGPPTSPQNGDIWFATNVDANGTVWQFRYNAGSSSASKWEFVGGPKVRIAVGAFEFTATTGSWTDTATVGPSYTTVRAGDYQVSCEADMSHSVSGTKVQVGPALGAGSAPDSFAVTAPAASGYGSGARLDFPFTAVSASQEIRLRYFSGAAGTMGNGNRVMLVNPVRVA